MSRLAVVAKGTPVEFRQNVGALSRSSASRDGESGIIGIQNLYYATWFIKTNCLLKHHFNQTIPIHRKSTFLAESYFFVENKTYRLAVFKKVRVFEHNTNDKKQYLLAKEKK